MFRRAKSSLALLLVKNKMDSPLEIENLEDFRAEIPVLDGSNCPKKTCRPNNTGKVTSEEPGWSKLKSENATEVTIIS